jgi:hypothetical protein
VSTKKPDELKKLLFEEPPRADMMLVLGARLQDVGVHSALAEPASQFLSDLYGEGLRLIRLLAPAAKNPDRITAELPGEIRQSASYLELRSGEALSFLERVTAFLDRKVEEDDDATEAFEKNVSRLEKQGRLEDPSALMQRLSHSPEVAATHGSWALSAIYGSLVKLVGILELVRFERVSPTTVANAMAEIYLDITHRLRPGLIGTDEGRTGLLEMLGVTSKAE